jgi:hypothetical protein
MAPFPGLQAELPSSPGKPGAATSGRATCAQHSGAIPPVNPTSPGDARRPHSEHPNTTPRPDQGLRDVWANLVQAVATADAHKTAISGAALVPPVHVDLPAAGGTVTHGLHVGGATPDGTAAHGLQVGALAVGGALAHGLHVDAAAAGGTVAHGAHVDAPAEASGTLPQRAPRQAGGGNAQGEQEAGRGVVARGGRAVAVVETVRDGGSPQAMRVCEDTQVSKEKEMSGDEEVVFAGKAGDPPPGLGLKPLSHRTYYSMLVKVQSRRF